MKVDTTLLDFPVIKADVQALYAKIPVILKLTQKVEDVVVKKIKHAYKDILFIDLSYPEGHLRLAAHFKFLKEFKERLANNDLSSFDEVVLDDEFAHHQYRGHTIENPYHYKVNSVDYIVDVYSEDTSIEWEGLLDGNFHHAERQLNATSKTISGAVHRIKDIIDGWPLKSGLSQTQDIYWSLDVVEDHKIVLCLDHLDVLGVENPYVERLPVTEERLVTYPEPDQVIIKKIMGEVDYINDTIAGLKVKVGYNKVLADFMVSIIENIVVRPLYYLVSVALPFNPGKKASIEMIDKEVAQIIEYLEDNDYYLDTSGMTIFTIEDGVQTLVKDDKIAKLWESYSESFGKAVNRALLLVSTDRFKPYAKITLVK